MRSNIGRSNIGASPSMTAKYAASVASRETISTMSGDRSVIVSSAAGKRLRNSRDNRPVPQPISRIWGAGGNGQLGNGTTTNSRNPVTVTGLTGATQLVGGYYYNCALMSGGTVRCWGYNAYGQLGDNSTTNRTTTVATSTITNLTQITAGEHHTCGVRRDGTVWCWGYNGYGQLGDGTTTNRYSPVAVSGITALLPAVELTAGDNHTCARLSDGTLRCWGYNGNGQLGDGTTTNRNAPIPVMGVTDAVQIAVGDRFSCALRQSGAVVCWGYNNIGQLGDGTTAQRVIPGAVPGITDATRRVAGSLHLCVRRATGAVQCWGGGTSGQLGDGGFVNRARIAPGVFAVPASESCTGMGCGEIQMSVTGYTGCTLTPSNRVACWGFNNNRQLGDSLATGGYRTAADYVEGLTDVAQVETGASHTCAITLDGALWCWGDNAFGQLGDGMTEDLPVPTIVEHMAEAVEITIPNVEAPGPAEPPVELRLLAEEKCWSFSVPVAVLVMEKDLENGIYRISMLSSYFCLLILRIALCLFYCLYSL